MIFVKDLVEYSHDYARTVAKDEFWYLDNDNTTVTNPATPFRNVGIHARYLLSRGVATVKTVIPLNRYSFFEELADKLLPPMQLEFEIVLQDDNEMIF